MSEIVVGGERFTLGQRIGKGGEGEVYAVEGKDQLAVKIYTTSDRSDKAAKITAMLQANLVKQAPYVAFPIAIAQARDGRFLGFVMRKVEAHKPIHNLYAPGSRKQHFPEADYRFLVRVAANITRAVASVHQAGCVIGDINHSSMLVSPRATVALIDADSFQLSFATQKFLCKVGVPEYTPPELSGADLSSTHRTNNHDAFGLAIILFQLLFMGRHPYAGRVRSGEAPALQENIRNHRFVYAEHRNVGMDQPPGTPTLSDFTPDVANAFERAFSDKPGVARPSAMEWIEALERLETELVQCKQNALHYSPRSASQCLWCEMERQFGTPMFVPYVRNAANAQTAFDPNSGAFNLSVFWAKVEALRFHDPQSLRPKLNLVRPVPSEAAIAAMNPKKVLPWLSIVAACALSVLGLIAQGAALWFIGAVAFALRALAAYNTPPPRKTQPFIDAYQAADKRWIEATRNWYSRLGYANTVGFNELHALRYDYLQLGAEQVQLTKAYRESRERNQLDSFLARFDIEDASLKGFGPSLVATLTSFGFDTAADLIYERLLGVPGIGPVKAQRLIDWRLGLSKRFKYDAHENDADRQHIAQINTQIRSKAQQLARKMGEIYEQLAQHVNQSTWQLDHVDTHLNQLYAQREHARKDLEVLGIAVPATTDPIAQGIDDIKRISSLQSRTLSVPSSLKTLTYPPPSPAPLAPVPTPVRAPVSVSAPPSSNATVSCPRCNSKMIQRLAKQGRNAGNYFWGCSRYPTCKGTQNI